MGRFGWFFFLLLAMTIDTTVSAENRRSVVIVVHGSIKQPARALLSQFLKRRGFQVRAKKLGREASNRRTIILEWNQSHSLKISDQHHLYKVSLPSSLGDHWLLARLVLNHTQLFLERTPTPTPKPQSKEDLLPSSKTEPRFKQRHTKALPGKRKAFIQRMRSQRPIRAYKRARLGSRSKRFQSPPAKRWKPTIRKVVRTKPVILKKRATPPTPTRVKKAKVVKVAIVTKASPAPIRTPREEPRTQPPRRRVQPTIRPVRKKQRPQAKKPQVRPRNIRIARRSSVLVRKLRPRQTSNFRIGFLTKPVWQVHMDFGLFIGTESAGAMFGGEIGAHVGYRGWRGLLQLRLESLVLQPGASFFLAQPALLAGSPELAFSSTWSGTVDLGLALEAMTNSQTQGGVFSTHRFGALLQVMALWKPFSVGYFYGKLALFASPLGGSFFATDGTTFAVLPVRLSFHIGFRWKTFSSRN